MNTRSHSFASRGRSVLFAGSLFAAGGLAWAASAIAGSSEKPSVSVKIDQKPVATQNGPTVTSFSPVVKRVSPSVVKVVVSENAKTVPAGDVPSFFNDPAFREFFGNQFDQRQGSRRQSRQPAQQGLGSGVIVSADGYVLTNNHVVQGADTVQISLNDGRTLSAKIVGTDPQTDLAVVKIDAKDLPAATFADSDNVEVGDFVLAVGNPFGIGQTVTGGMVSGLGRATLGLDYEDFIQTDAAINPGNSGGALVDTEGRLVGINTAILSRSGGFQGIGFAIPANLARSVMEQLVSNGKVVRGYLGVTTQDVTPALASEFGLEKNKGALVAEVNPNSPAARAGLKGGDVLTQFNGKTVTDSRHLKLIVANVAPGTKVPAEVIRDGQITKVELQLSERPGAKELAQAGNQGSSGNGDDSDEGGLNGVAVADLDSNIRREFDIPARVRGAVVTEVAPDSIAAAAGLQPGDVIEEINRKPIRSADDAVKLSAKPETKKSLLRVWSPRGTRYVMVDETKGAPPS